jgi:hypothetical protein
MLDYRIYEIDKIGRVVGHSHRITCDNDDDAVQKATPLMGDRDVEVWQGLASWLRFGPQRARQGALGGGLIIVKTTERPALSARHHLQAP